MNARVTFSGHRFLKPLLKRVVMTLSLLSLSAGLLSGCNSQDSVAGTSSGVDNPQIVVAFTSSSGSPKTTSGTISIYSSDQNPAVDPDPILQTRIDSETSIQFSRSDFTRSDSDSTQYFNVLLIGDDSTGGLLQRLAYNPVKKTFSFAGGSSISKATLSLSALVTDTASINLASQGGPQRVFIPGTPFQSVVVDSGFILSQIPPGVFPLHLLTSQGKELPLPDSLNTHVAGPPHRVDTTATPVNQPPPPPPPTGLKANAGADQNVFMGAQTFLSGLVMGVSPDDPRLAVLWTQISPDPKTLAANIANASQLKTPVGFPKPGAYTFVLSVSYGNNGTAQDTVSIGVQPASIPPFVQPTPGDTTVIIGHPYNIVWNVPRIDTLSLQLSTNGGSNWSASVATGIVAFPGKLNSYSWTPASTLSPSNNCEVRFVNATDTLLSPKFSLKSAPATAAGLKSHPK